MHHNTKNLIEIESYIEYPGSIVKPCIKYTHLEQIYKIVRMGNIVYFQRDTTGQFYAL